MLRIAYQDQEAEIVTKGGTLKRYVADLAGKPRDVLYCPPGSDPSPPRPRFFGNWPMLPFANRAFGGVVEDGDIRFEVPRNDHTGDGAIHGFGWQDDWAVEESGPSQVVLRHSRSEGPDPYRYDCRQTIALGPEGLRIDLEIINRADRTLPFGFGQHPWFPVAGATLKLAAEAFLRIKPDFHAIGIEPLGPDQDFSVAKPVAAEFERVVNFLGWDGRAEIGYPAEGCRVLLTAAPIFGTPLLWAPTKSDFFCLEPQSHAVGAPADAIARAASPLTRLAPGESMAGWIAIRQEAV